MNKMWYIHPIEYHSAIKNHFVAAKPQKKNYMDESK
jgi:hypothetical protein